MPLLVIRKNHGLKPFRSQKLIMKVSGFLPLVFMIFMLFISCNGKTVEPEPIINQSGTEAPKISAIQIDGFSCWER